MSLPKVILKSCEVINHDNAYPININTGKTIVNERMSEVKMSFVTYDDIHSDSFYVTAGIELLTKGTNIKIEDIMKAFPEEFI